MIRKLIRKLLKNMTKDFDLEKKVHTKLHHPYVHMCDTLESRIRPSLLEKNAWTYSAKMRKNSHKVLEHRSMQTSLPHPHTHMIWTRTVCRLLGFGGFSDGWLPDCTLPVPSWVFNKRPTYGVIFFCVKPRRRRWWCFYLHKISRILRSDKT